MFNHIADFQQILNCETGGEGERKSSVEHIFVLIKRHLIVFNGRMSFVFIKTFDRFFFLTVSVSMTCMGRKKASDTFIW